MSKALQVLEPKEILCAMLLDTMFLLIWMSSGQ